MVSWLKRQWGDLRKGQPGRRFQDRYERKRHTPSGKAARAFQLTVAIVLIGAGLVFCVMPGPGLPLIILGAAVLAERSVFLAQALDWAEVKLRAALRRGLGWWRKASKVARHAVILFAILAITGASYGAWHVVFGR